jgi:hypothetical protein
MTANKYIKKTRRMLSVRDNFLLSVNMSLIWAERGNGAGS